MKTKINALLLTLTTLLLVNCDVPDDEAVGSTLTPRGDESAMSSLLSTTANDPNDGSVELDKPGLLAEQFNADRERTLIGTLKMLSGAGQDAEEPRIPGIPGFPPPVLCLWGDCGPQSPRPQPDPQFSPCSAKCTFSSCSGDGTCTCSLGSAECGPKLAAAPSSSAEQRTNLDRFIALSESAGARDLAESARELREALTLGDVAAIAEAAEALECEAEALTNVR
jgi:hypothetical protein